MYLQANEVAGIKEDCQHVIWKHIVSLTKDENVKELTTLNCGTELDKFGCEITSTSGTYLACIIDKREQIKSPQCLEYVQRLEWVAFSDFKIVTHFDSDCETEIEKFKCGRIQPYKEISQGQTLACLQKEIEQLGTQCKKRVLHVSEIQADNIKLDRQLYMACTQDHIKFCPDIRPGSGQVYKCLMQHKTDRSMTKQCQDQLTRREKLIASDYKVSKGLVRACKEDIKIYHCRRSLSEDKDIKLAQILLCLESAIKNMSKIAPDCQVEMFDHRKMLMDDYKLSPEIVNDCNGDISNFCNGLEVGGKTIHCLMEHARPRKKKSRITSVCQRAVSYFILFSPLFNLLRLNQFINYLTMYDGFLFFVSQLEGLIKETDVGEDWRLDPVLHDACQPVVDSACRDVGFIISVEIVFSFKKIIFF